MNISVAEFARRWVHVRLDHLSWTDILKRIWSILQNEGRPCNKVAYHVVPLKNQKPKDFRNNVPTSHLECYQALHLGKCYIQKLASTWLRRFQWATSNCKISSLIFIYEALIRETCHPKVGVGQFLNKFKLENGVVYDLWETLKKHTLQLVVITIVKHLFISSSALKWCWHPQWWSIMLCKSYETRKRHWFLELSEEQQSNRPEKKGFMYCCVCRYPEPFDTSEQLTLARILHQWWHPSWGKQIQLCKGGTR